MGSKDSFDDAGGKKKEMEKGGRRNEEEEKGWNSRVEKKHQRA